eukprot:scaffold89977_cov64-Phaeocystis_antarctica.AAC.4
MHTAAPVSSWHAPWVPHTTSSQGCSAMISISACTEPATILGTFIRCAGIPKREARLRTRYCGSKNSSTVTWSGQGLGPIKELTDTDLEAEGKLDGVDRLDGHRMGDAAAHHHVELALPRREEVGAARVVHSGFDRGEVVRVIGERCHLRAAVVHLQHLGVRVEARDQYLGQVGVVRGPAVSARHHQPQVLWVGAREGQVVPAAQRDGGVEGHEALQAVVPATIKRALVVPPGVHQVDVAACRQSHRHERA